jgi:hypothetical protein
VTYVMNASESYLAVMQESLWVTSRIGPYTFDVINLDHPQVHATILREIKSGVDVYYDRRWEVTDTFCRFLVDQQKWVFNRSVLILGVGLGMETLVIGRLCRKLYLNDLAPIALELCTMQLRKNNIRNFYIFLGRYENIHFPLVDMIVGCFLVYNAETLKAMKRFLTISSQPILLMNEPLPPFQRLLKITHRKLSHILPNSPCPCILFE